MMMSTTAMLAAVVFEASFAKGLPGWEQTNGSTTMDCETMAGEAALVVRHSAENPSAGTYWSVRGKPFPVTPGTRLSIIVRAMSTLSDVRALSGYGRCYVNGFCWYDRDGRELTRPFGFGYELDPGKWRNTGAVAEVPAEASTARLSLGMDSPNLGSNDWFAVSSAKVIVEDVPAPEERLSLRDDGMLLVGGKPFFPIGIYHVVKCDFNSNSYDRAFRDLKAAGFNLVHRASPAPFEETEEFLTAAERLDLKVFIPPVVSLSGDFVQGNRELDLMHHRSILAWYLADDTASNTTPEQLAYRNMICKTLDPTRLTLQADPVMSGGSNNRYDLYVHFTDLFLPEIYPARGNEELACEVSEVVRDMEEIRGSIVRAGCPVKGIWPIIQHFDGWGWKRFPTFAEMRAMSWASIVHGANGITWYVYHSLSGRGRGVVSSPERWDEMTRVSREIAAVQESLADRDAAVQPTVEILEGPKTDFYGFPSETAGLKGGNEPLLIAVHATTNAVTARLTIGRRCKPATFGPYDVKLIRNGMDWN